MKKLAVARLGRSVGLRGDMKLHNLSDFPEQFVKGATFQSDRGELEIEHYNPQRGTVKFKGIDSPEEAKKLTNVYLYSSEEETKKHIALEEGEYFWFDILGCRVYEEGKPLGEVKDIARYPAADYLVIATDKALIEQGKPKRFLVPFLDRFVEDVDIEAKRIELRGAQDILDAS